MIGAQTNIQNNGSWTEKGAKSDRISTSGSWMTRSKEALVYHLFCGLYLFLLMMLLTLYIVNSFKSKHISPTPCSELNNPDDYLFYRIFSVLFYTTLLLASGLVFTSLKYVSEYENQSLIDLEQRNGRRRSSQASKTERVEEFIRRNSSVPIPSVILQRNVSDASSRSPWLNSVKNSAYETHRRMSTVQAPPPTLSFTLPQNGSKGPEIVIDHHNES